MKTITPTLTPTTFLLPADDLRGTLIPMRWTGA